MTILCISDDEKVETRVAKAAEDLQWTMFSANHETVPTAVAQHNPDLIVVHARSNEDLDKWRKWPGLGQKNVVCLHGSADASWMTKALNAGADMLLPEEMVSSALFEAAMNSLARRQAARADKIHIERLGVTLNHEDERLEMGERNAEFTETEYKILRILVREETAIVNRAEILTKVFGSASLSSRSLDVHICTLRKKLRPFGLDIVSVRGVGYKVRGMNHRAE